MARVPEEIQEAMELLENYKNSTDHEERNEDFRNALEIIRDFLEDYPDSIYKTHAESIKTKYIQIFLNELPNLHYLDIDVWSYYLITVSSWRNDFDKEMGRFSYLKENYDEYSLIWRDEIRDMILKS